MCDYSLQLVKSRPAAVGDKLVTTNFGFGTRGFAGSDDRNTAVCVLPGTELSFDDPVIIFGETVPKHTTARFRQVNKDQPQMHHDTLEFPDGTTSLLTFVLDDQCATVLQLPAAPKTEAEAEAQRRVEYVG